MQKIKIILGTLLFLPTVAQAQWYIGTGLGQTHMERENFAYESTSPQVKWTYKDSDSSFKLLGGWRATPSLAVEFGYIDLGEYKLDYTSPGLNYEFTTSATAVFSELVGNIDLGSGWSFLAKLGLAYWDAEVNYSDNTPFSNSGSDTGVDTLLGIGFEYGFKLGATKMGARLEWEQYQNVAEGAAFKDEPSDTNTSNGRDINVLGLTATFDF